MVEAQSRSVAALRKGDKAEPYRIGGVCVSTKLGIGQSSQACSSFSCAAAQHKLFVRLCRSHLCFPAMFALHSNTADLA